jgi:hypothetical protein
MLVRNFRSWLLALAVLLTAAAPATAGTLNVAVTGADADGCGTKTAPCRSISRAIANAVAGDKIVVGPGRYGDLDADGTLGEPGEESAADAGMVVIDKPLTVESVEGAATTVIDANGGDVNAVAITASGVKLGKPKKGFTVTGSDRAGVAIGFASDVIVSGIRSIRNDIGFGSKSSGIVFRTNVAEANAADGFVFTGGGCSFSACRATANGGNGFALSGDGGGHVVKSCVASANGEAGFLIFSNGSSVTKSVANGNDVGMTVGAGGSPQLGTNAFLGNRRSGVIVTAPNVTLTKSNVFGNGNDGTNCGVSVAGAGTVILDRICFGAPTGPGDDPADQTCGGPGGGIEILEILQKVIAISPKVPL